MSNIENLKQELQRSNRKIWRKLYFKNRDTSGNYTSWVEIESERIISFGQISMQYESANNFINSGSFSIRLKNSDAYFNPPDDSHSFWKNSISQLRTLIKISVGYVDENGVNQPEAGNVFMGFINSELQYTDTEVTIQANSLMDIFKQYEAENLVNLYTTSAHTYISLSDLINRVAMYTDGSSKYIFQDFFSSSAWRTEATTNWFKHNSWPNYGIPSETISDITLYDLFENMARVENALIFVDNNGNFVCKRRESIMGLYDESEITNKPESLYMHTRFNNSGISGRGPVWYWTNTATYESCKYENGARISADENYLTSTSQFVQCTVTTCRTTGAWNTDKFTIEFWVKPRFNLDTHGTASSWDYGPPLLAPPTWFALATNGAQNTNALFIRWDGLGGGPNKVLNIDKRGSFNTLASLYCDTTTMQWNAGSLNFLAFVHDNSGINNTNDKFRIYHAADGGSITLIASCTGTSATMQPKTSATLYLGGAGIDTISAFPAAAIFDNVKIYNYAKTYFSDRDYEMHYTEQIGFPINAGGDGITSITINATDDLKKKISIDNVYNKVRIKFIDLDTTTSFAKARDTASSELYGVREYAQDCFYLNTVSAQDMADELLGQFKNPKIQIELKTTLIPEANPESLIRIFHKSKPLNMGSPFSDGFSDGFGDLARSIEINSDFKIKKAKHDLDKMTSSFTLEEY